MQFGRLILIGATLVALAPAASATLLLAGDIDLSGTGVTISTTKLTFGGVNGTKTSPNFQQAAGTVTGATGSLVGFAGGTEWNVPNATDTTQNASHQYKNRTAAANLVYASVTTPVLFFQVFEGGNTLDFFLTAVTGETVGTAKMKGAFSATGYVTINGLDQTNGTYTLTDTNFNSGHSPFTAIFDIPAPPPPPPPAVPEPSSLALLGTGVIGIAGFIFRKRDKVQE